MYVSKPYDAITGTERNREMSVSDTKRQSLNYMVQYSI